MCKLKRSECVVLTLVLKDQWFYMIASGEKREEYRDYTAYWEKRIINWRDKRGLHVVEFRLGYAKNAPKMWFTVGDVFLRREAHTHTWGEPGSDHYAIVLGERIELEDGKALNESDQQRKVVRLATCDIGKALCALHIEDERRTKYIWTCRNGREIAVEDMSDEHLTNTIAMLERKMHEREIVEENRGEVFE